MFLPDKILDLGAIGKPQENIPPDYNQVKQLVNAILARQESIIKVLDTHREYFDQLGKAFLTLDEKYETLRKDHRRLARYVNGNDVDLTRRNSGAIIEAELLGRDGHSSDGDNRPVDWVEGSSGDADTGSGEVPDSETPRDK